MATASNFKTAKTQFWSGLGALFAVWEVIMVAILHAAEGVGFITKSFRAESEHDFEVDQLSLDEKKETFKMESAQRRAAMLATTTSTALPAP